MSRKRTESAGCLETAFRSCEMREQDTPPETRRGSCGGCEAQAGGAEKSALTRRIAVTLKAPKSVSCDGQAPGAVDAAPSAASSLRVFCLQIPVNRPSDDLAHWSTCAFLVPQQLRALLVLEVDQDLLDVDRLGGLRPSCDRLIVAACRAYEVLISRCAKLRPDAHLTGDPA